MEKSDPNRRRGRRRSCRPHSKGIIHRDLKPENLFLTPEDRVKILDFGPAQWVPVGDSNQTILQTQSDAGTIVGTVGYMAPEQVRGLAAEASCDIFALGCSWTK